MKKFLISSLLVTSILQAQFIFKGTINNYSNKRVIVKLDRAFDDILIGNTSTDATGTFSVPIKEKYTGVIEVSLLDAKSSFILLSDNTPINFTGTINSNNNFTLNNPGNPINKTFIDYQNYDTKKNSILPQLQNIINSYKPTDAFYPQLKNEIQTISNLNKPDLSSYPFLSYYIPASEIIKNSDTGEPSSSKKAIMEHLINAGEEFETSGLGRSMLYNYLKLSSTGGTNQADWENKVDKAIQNLLDEVGEDTSRGQEILSAAINFLNGYSITTLANKYMSKAESLTCEITPELKETINKNNNIKEGKIIPNLKFTHKLDGKYSSLYDIKTKYKLIMVWASWCGHCQQEMPFVKQFYENFKKSGGEIIGLSADYEKGPWEDTIKDLPWLNDSDLLYWDSRFVKDLNVTGTPTLFLVDKDNKILKITSKISDINNLIK